MATKKPTTSKKLTHLDPQGRAAMVDVSPKPAMHRTAIATVDFHAASATLDLLYAGKLPKGDALAVARIAGICAAKRTDELIPLCHSLPLDHVQVEFVRCQRTTIRITTTARTTARTGVEMEALTAASLAALTLYDMSKAVDRKLRIDNLRLLEKRKSPVERSSV